MSDVLEDSMKIRDSLFEVGRYFSEIDSLNCIIEVQLPGRMEENSCVRQVVFEDTFHEDSSDGRITQLSSLAFNLKSKGKKKFDGSISIQIVAFGSPQDAFYGIPVLIASAGNYVLELADYDATHWFPSKVEKSVGEIISTECGRRVVRVKSQSESSGDTTEYYFVIPLLKLQSASSLASLVYEPLSILLSCLFDGRSLGENDIKKFEHAIPIQAIPEGDRIGYQADFNGYQ